MVTKTNRFDAADYINTAEDVIAHIEAAFEDGDPAVITMTLGDIARSKGMTAVAKEAGVTREALYKALSADGDPKLSTLLGVMKALGLQLTVIRGRAA